MAADDTPRPSFPHRAITRISLFAAFQGLSSGAEWEKQRNLLGFLYITGPL